MKKVFIFCVLMCMVSLVQSQSSIKLHPNCNGNPPLTQEELDSIPVLNISPPSAQLSLPLKVDNSQLPYMPDLFKQVGGSCSQASGIQYIFSYEINRLRGTNPNDSYRNHFHHLSTYNHVRASSNASSLIDGWEMVKEIGIPNYETYGNWEDDLTYWMHGYDKWHSGEQYRIDDYYFIRLKLNGEGLDDLKHWLNDHGNAETTGGLASFEMSSYATFI